MYWWLFHFRPFSLWWEMLFFVNTGCMFSRTKQLMYFFFSSFHFYGIFSSFFFLTSIHLTNWFYHQMLFFWNTKPILTQKKDRKFHSKWNIEWIESEKVKKLNDTYVTSDKWWPFTFERNQVTNKSFPLVIKNINKTKTQHVQ